MLLGFTADDEEIENLAKEILKDWNFGHFLIVSVCRLSVVFERSINTLFLTEMVQRMS